MSKLWAKVEGFLGKFFSDAKDVASRAGWTFVQTFIAVLSAQALTGLNSPAPWITAATAAGAAALSILKSYIKEKAKQV